MNKYIAYVAFSLIAVCWYFAANSEIDLLISKGFYAGGFIAKTVFPYNVLYLSGKFIVILIVLSSLLLFCMNFLKSKTNFGIKNSYIAYICTSALVGPYFIVHGIFKEYFPRARPEQVIEFGGDAIFQPIFTFALDCYDCQSFASGHAAGAFFLTSFLFIVQEKYRNIAASIILPYAFLVSYSRLVNGGHFLSDVMIGALVAILVNFVMAYIFLDEFHKEDKKLVRFTKFIDNFYLKRFK